MRDGVTYPRCGYQAWVAGRYNDPCQHWGKAVPGRYVR